MRHVSNYANRVQDARCDANARFCGGQKWRPPFGRSFWPSDSNRLLCDFVMPIFTPEIQLHIFQEILKLYHKELKCFRLLLHALMAY